MNCSPLGSSVHGILQARILEGFAHALLQEIFPTQGSNPCLYIYCIGKRALFHWHHLGSPSVSYQDLKDANEGVGEQTELGMIKLHFKQLCTSRFQPEESSCWYFGGFPLEKEMAAHSIVLAWRIPGMGQPGGLPSMGSHRVEHNWSDLGDHKKQIYILTWIYILFNLRTTLLLPVSLIAPPLIVKSNPVCKIMYIDALTFSYLFLDTVNKYYSIHHVLSTDLGPTFVPLE